MIDDDTEPVVVRYGTAEEQKSVRDAINKLRTQQGSPRDLIRRLQPYVVALRKKTELQQAQRAGLLVEVIPGLWEWQGNYDTTNGTGIVLGGSIEPERTIW